MSNEVKTKRTVLHLSCELVDAIDAARGDAPRSGWIESQLWKLKSVKDGADEAGVENPKRSVDKRGKWERGAG